MWLRRWFAGCCGGGREPETEPEPEPVAVPRSISTPSLDAVNWAEIPRFSFDVGHRVPAYFVGNYDGDTATLGWYFRGVPTVASCRLFGIDTPELRDRNEAVKIRAFAAKDALAAMADEVNRRVWVEFGANDKYGRPLVALFPDETTSLSFNERLVALQLAQRYFGGTKAAPDPA